MQTGWFKEVRVKDLDSHAVKALLASRSLEIAGVMSFVQLFFKRPAGAIDHSPALNGRAFADFFRPACQVFIFVRPQELARVVV
jgi:hypothetical protein